jgi:hypothetical protein
VDPAWTPPPTMRIKKNIYFFLQTVEKFVTEWLRYISFFGSIWTVLIHYVRFFFYFSQQGSFSYITHNFMHVTHAN